MDLRVEIPKKFKKSLKRRFSLWRVENEVDEYGRRYYIISRMCPLCDYYGYDCERCPFKKFQRRKILFIRNKHGEPGCISWMREIIGEEFYFWQDAIEVGWWVENNKKARKQIKELKRKARKLITWI